MSVIDESAVDPAPTFGVLVINVFGVLLLISAGVMGLLFAFGLVNVNLSLWIMIGIAVVVGVYSRAAARSMYSTEIETHNVKRRTELLLNKEGRS